MRSTTQKIFEECLKRYPELSPCKDSILHAFDAIVESFQKGGKMLVCGNGGSASDAEHIVGEMMNKFMLIRPIPATFAEKLRTYENGDFLASHLQQSLPAISLVSQTSLLTAIANDISAEMIFAQQVYGYGSRGDTLLALTTSGNSTNVLNAVKVAKALGIKTIGFTNENGGMLKSISDITILAPTSTTFKVQELHLPIYHAICAMVEEEVFGKSQ